MKSIIRVLLVALALGATGAYAQPKSDSTAAKYDNSANWRVGG
jgi:hypothetical protein